MKGLYERICKKGVNLVMTAEGDVWIRSTVPTFRNVKDR